MIRPRVMGVVNVTPDSFSDGGQLGSVAAAVVCLRRSAQVIRILDVAETRQAVAHWPAIEEGGGRR